MPADRAFSLVERHIKKRQTILEPKEYDDILESCGNLVKVGHDFIVHDYAASAKLALKVGIIFYQVADQYCIITNLCPLFCLGPKRIFNI